VRQFLGTHADSGYPDLEVDGCKEHWPSHVFLRRVQNSEKRKKKNDLNFFEPAPSLLTDLKRVMLERGCDVDEDPLRVTGARVGGVVVLLPFDVGCDGEPASG